MTDKEKIREEVQRLILRGACSSQVVMDTRCKEEAYNEVLAIIDNIQEEPVSEELGKAAVEAFKQIVDSDKNNFLEVFKAGAKWQEKQDQETIELAEDHAMLAGMEKMKEQMMAKAVDEEVHIDAGGYPYIPQMELYDYDKDIPLAKEGDKYKVILIKEE